MTRPLVSIIIPAFNAGPFIAETLASVFSQSYPNIETIVVDDSSTDDTAAILARYQAGIRLIHQPNRGAAAARNAGYRCAQGTYIKFLDADDLIDPEMIARQVALAQRHPDAVISAKWGRFYRNELSSFQLNPEECWQDMPAVDWLFSSWRHASSTTVPGIFLIPRRIIERAGAWNERLSLLDDAEYFARTILQADRVIFSADSTLYYRSGLRNNLSGRTDAAAFRSAFEAYSGVVNALLAARRDHHAQTVAANIWQLFIYRTYPESPELIRLAEQALKRLPKADISFPAGGYTLLLSRVIGWKITKRLKFFLKRST